MKSSMDSLEESFQYRWNLPRSEYALTLKEYGEGLSSTNSEILHSAIRSYLNHKLILVHFFA